jgi:hypothetical protein
MSKGTGKSAAPTEKVLYLLTPGRVILGKGILRSYTAVWPQGKGKGKGTAATESYTVEWIHHPMILSRGGQGPLISPAIVEVEYQYQYPAPQQEQQIQQGHPEPGLPWGRPGGLPGREEQPGPAQAPQGQVQAAQQQERERRQNRSRSRSR